MNPFAKAALGAVFIGLGLSLMMGATRSLKPCEPDELAVEETASTVAAASAEMTGEEE